MLERLLDPLFSLLAPHLCLGCGLEGALLCSDCQELLPQASPPAPPTGVRHLQVATPYEFVGEALLHAYKFERGYGAHRAIAGALARLDFPAGALLVPVPTATSRVRQRGHDHMLTITRRLSKLTGLPHQQLLTRSGQQRQTGKSRRERQTQLAGAYELRGSLPKSTHIVLVDDVVTTGATLEACARALRKAGAKQISAIAFARKE